MTVTLPLRLTSRLALGKTKRKRKVPTGLSGLLEAPPAGRSPMLR